MTSNRLITIGNRTRGNLLKCPRCSSEFNGVTDTRRIEDGRTVRRRRACAECDFRWSTYERWQKHTTTAGRRSELFDRWMNVHDICGIGKRAVELTK